jgi:ethanolamine kinase
MLTYAILKMKNSFIQGNVIYDENLSRISFIDFEYSGMNYQAFDIGNHFNEYAGTENIDYNHYPNKEYQLDWLKTYLLEYFATNVDFVDY